MTGTTDEAARPLARARPKYSLLSNALASILLGAAPVFGVAGWFASERGGAEIVVIAGLLVILAGLLLLRRQLSVHCTVTETELIGNGIFSPIIRMRLDEIREVLLVPTYLGAAPDPVLQLLVTDTHGRRFRLRGNFWHESDLLELAAALPVRYELMAEPMTLRDFLRAYPGSAYWFEDRRPRRIVLFALLTLVAVGAATVAMLALGLPVRFTG